MRTNIDQDIVDEKIHRFLARKSPMKTFSEIIADHLVPVQFKRRKTGITYEQTQWDNSHVLHSR